MGEGDLAAMDTVLVGRLQAHSRVWVYRANPTLYYYIIIMQINSLNPQLIN